MWILIDRDRMCITHKHTLQSAIQNVAHIEMAHQAVFICDEMDASSFDGLTDLELKLLHRNMCGEEFKGFGRDQLVSMTRAICHSLYESKIQGFEAALQANSIAMDDTRSYKYVAGSGTPAPQEELYTPAPLTTAPGVTLTLPPTPHKQTPPAHATQAAGVPASAPRTPRNHTSGESVPGRPKAGSKTGLVWEIADELYEDYYAVHQCAPDWKELRRSIIAKCDAEGINGSTASVQAGAWKQSKGL